MNTASKVAYSLISLLIAVYVGSLAGDGPERWGALLLVLTMGFAVGVPLFRAIDRSWPPPA